MAVELIQQYIQHDRWNDIEVGSGAWGQVTAGEDFNHG